MEELVYVHQMYDKGTKIQNIFLPFIRYPDNYNNMKRTIQCNKWDVIHLDALFLVSNPQLVSLRVELSAQMGMPEVYPWKGFHDINHDIRRS